jgi:hypothetical protein
MVGATGAQYLGLAVALLPWAAASYREATRQTWLQPAFVRPGLARVAARARAVGRPRLAAEDENGGGEGVVAAESFRELYSGQLPPWLISRVEALGFTHPTAVQTRAMEPILGGEDVILHAQTGACLRRPLHAHTHTPVV